MVHQSNLTNFATCWFGTPKQTPQCSTRLPRFSQTERGNLTQRLTLWDKLLGLGKVLKLTILFVTHAGRLNSKHWLQKKEVKSDAGWCTSMSKEPIASKPGFYFTDFFPPPLLNGIISTSSRWFFRVHPMARRYFLTRLYLCPTRVCLTCSICGSAMDVPIFQIPLVSCPLENVLWN